MGDFLTNYGITITYILLGIAILAAVGSSIVNMISNKKAAMMTVIGIVGLGAVALIAKAMASDVVTPEYETFGIDAAASANVGMGIYTYYILFFLAIAAVLYTEISKIFK